MVKCLKDVWETTLKVDLWGLLGNPHGGRGDIKDERIGRVSEKRNNLALEKGHIKHTERCWELQGMDNFTSEMRNSSNCTSW